MVEAKSNVNYSHELKKARIGASLTQVESAKLIGVSRRTYQRYEACEVEINHALFEMFLIKCSRINAINS